MKNLIFCILSVLISGCVSQNAERALEEECKKSQLMNINLIKKSSEIENIYLKDNGAAPAIHLMVRAYEIFGPAIYYVNANKSSYLYSSFKLSNKTKSGKFFIIDASECSGKEYVELCGIAKYSEDLKYDYEFTSHLEIKNIDGDFKIQKESLRVKDKNLKTIYLDYSLRLIHPSKIMFTEINETSSCKGNY